MNAGLLSPNIAAIYLGLSKATIYRLIREGKLPAVRLGRTYRVPYEDLLPLLASRGGEAAARDRLFQRVLKIAEKNPDVDGDALLEDLEREDAARRLAARAG
jgi:excisionase family DNA binding protein